MLLLFHLLSLVRELVLSGLIMLTVLELRPDLLPVLLTQLVHITVSMLKMQVSDASLLALHHPHVSLCNCFMTMHSVTILFQHAPMGISGWLVALLTLKAASRSATMQCGEQCVMMPGVTLMPMLFAGNWDILQQVMSCITTLRLKEQQF